MKSFRAEHELLICVARKSLDQSVVDRLRQLLQQPINWDFLFAAASTHGLLPLLSHHLQISAPELIPEEILSRLRGISIDSSRSNLYLLRELLRITQLFSQHGIRTLTFKGPVLGQMVYGDVGLRQAGDLDLLIAKEDFTSAKELLQSNNYLMHPQLTDAQQKSHLGFHCEIQFLHEDQFSVVDLHWGLSPKTFPFSLPFEELWSRRQAVRIAAQSIETFSDEDLLLYLCVHGAKHYWERLEWVASVAELIRSRPHIDWSLVRSRASQTHTKKILALGLRLAESLFALELANKGSDADDEGLRESASRLERNLFREPALVPTQAQAFRWNLLLMDNKSDAVKSLMRSLFVPTISDWEATQIPDEIYPLYYGIRPFRLIGKYAFRK